MIKYEAARTVMEYAEDIVADINADCIADGAEDNTVEWSGNIFVHRNAMWVEVNVINEGTSFLAYKSNDERWTAASCEQIRQGLVG